MAIRKVHSDTARAARKIAREELGVQKPKIRKATQGEQMKGLAKAGFNFQQIRDVVVVEDRKNGKEYLVGVDLDPAASRHLNAESGVLTLSGLIPVIGAPVVAAFAIKDIVKGGVPALKAKFQGEGVSAKDRAILRMGFKHLGLSGLSLASTGLSHASHAAHSASSAAVQSGAQGVDAVYTAVEHAHNLDAAALAAQTANQAAALGEGVHAASQAADVAHSVVHAHAKASHGFDVAKAAHQVHVGVMAAEVTIGAKDIAYGTEPGSRLKGIAKSIKMGVGAILNSVVAGLKGLAGVHHPEEHHKEDARLLFAVARPLGGGKKLSKDQQPVVKDGKRVRPPATGPPAIPSVPDDIQ